MSKTDGKPDKVVILNRSAMMAKYGPEGLGLVEQSMQRLVAADARRGIATRTIAIDDAAVMAGLAGSPILGRTDEAGAKRAVDAVCARLDPDYLLLLDGPDAIPHIGLQPVPGIEDGDGDIPSDLPYACPAAFSTKPHDYTSVTRVVGRLPMVPGRRDGAAFARIIDRASGQAPGAVAGEGSYFAISADAWAASTRLSLSALFGDHGALCVAPAASHAAIDPALKRRLHLVNCHGWRAHASFYGEQDDQLYPAMSSADAAPHLIEGTVAGVECCYGAELYDPDLAGTDQPMCMAYLAAGAAGYLGSTNIAYGGSDVCAQADLLVQYFLAEVIKGRSLGRALLQARQRFVRTKPMSSPTNLKTLAQFTLYGDPSTVPVAVPAAPDAARAAVADALGDPKDEAAARKARRVALRGEGRAVGSAATRLGARVRRTAPVHDRVSALARDLGFARSGQVFDVSGGPAFRAAAKGVDRRQQVAVFTRARAEPWAVHRGGPVPSVHVLVAHILGDGIVSVERSVSR